ncbi:MAG: agmatine deiminase family protein [Lysobacteraceae bacterium]|nr:MAG: agmatine deiminase family protein [Xanthomonadaceae bacterium]
MTAENVRFPAEWEPQAAILIAWPNSDTDWADRLAEVEETYIALVAAIVRFQRVVICVADDDVETYAEMRLRSNRVDMARVSFVTVPYDDTWLRDSGPISLRDGAGFRLLDFRFTGWGGKFDASDDDQLVQRLAEQRQFLASERHAIDFALEGGAIETDGEGTLLTTWQCLHERHPEASREELTDKLAGWLRQDRVLWLDHGALEGDDTDAHIDTLARFAPGNAIVFQACDDATDSHYADLKAMADEIAALRTRDGQPYRLFPLPWARPVLDIGENGSRRLAASYANFLIINGAVLMPAYGDAADNAAAKVLADAFPDREIVQVPCRPLIWQNGSLHCITMQLPEGLV